MTSGMRERHKDRPLEGEVRVVGADQDAVDLELKLALVLQLHDLAVPQIHLQPPAVHGLARGAVPVAQLACDRRGTVLLGLFDAGNPAQFLLANSPHACLR